MMWNDSRWKMPEAKHGSQKYQAPLQPTYAAMHLPNGDLTVFGRKYLLKKLAEERKNERDSQM